MTAEAQGLTLGALLVRLEEAHVAVYSFSGDRETRVIGVTHDSRLVQPGWVYVARKGGARDGHEFVAAALARGAVALVVEDMIEGLSECGSVPVIRVNNTRKALGSLAHAVAGDPSRTLPVFGITGTNGKTTTSFFVAQLLALTSGKDDCAVLGTLGTFLGSMYIPATHTTPEADALAGQLAELRHEGASAVAMEVSSIALCEGRLEGVHFDAVAFTNLSQDHLDYHGTMQAYGEAKARLFTECPWRHAVICIDGSAGEDLSLDVANEIQNQSTHDASAWRHRTLRRVSTVRGARADLVMHAVQSNLSGMLVQCEYADESLQFETPLVGAYNLENLAVASGIALGQGRDIHALAEAASKLNGVRGRMERVTPLEHPFVVVVDYSHTPDALERALLALRPSTRGKLRVVFGCGGDRDRGKRPLMGDIGSRLADVVYLADDNPRSEQASDILDAIEHGIDSQNRSKVQRIGDRAEAIACAVADCDPGDVLLIAGKGHETTQTIGAQVSTFDDREVARLALSVRPVG